jgi:hypothetical protein
LGFSKESESEIKRYFDILRSPDSRLAEALEVIQIVGDQDRGINISHLKTLFFQVIPRLSNLRTLALFRCDGKNIVDIAKQIRNGELFLTSPIQSLDQVHWFNTPSAENPIAANEDPGLQATIPTFLKTFHTIVIMTFPKGMKIRPEWEYGMIQNLAGRRLLEGSNIVADERGSVSNGLPLSAWPIILQQFQREIDRAPAKNDPPLPESWWEELRTNQSKAISSKATGIYYLLREGPALIGRLDLNGRPKGVSDGLSEVVSEGSPSPARKRNLICILILFLGLLIFFHPPWEDCSYAKTVCNCCTCDRR